MKGFLIGLSIIPNYFVVGIVVVAAIMKIHPPHPPTVYEAAGLVLLWPVLLVGHVIQGVGYVIGRVVLWMAGIPA